MAGWKRYVFWIVLVGFLLLVVAYDQSAFYLYLPRLGAVVVALVVVCPALYVLGADKRVAFGAMVLAARTSTLRRQRATPTSAWSTWRMASWTGL